MHKSDKKIKELMPQKSYLIRWFLRFWKVIVFLSVFCTLIGAYLSLSPNITVSTSQSLDLIDPLSTPFVISNNGPLAIHSVEFLCQINEIVTVAGVTYKGPGKLGYAIPSLPILYRHEQKTFWWPRIINFHAPIRSADISILVIYRPAFLPWRKSEVHRFETKRNKDGLLFWYKKPLLE